MRIISGRFKGRVIRLPKGIRPTQDKVREALFDILGDIQGLSFLELYAGSGAVGLEALSQGAGKVVFVERDRVCIAGIKQNLAAFGFSPNPPQAEKAKTGERVSELAHCHLIEMDVDRALEQLNQNAEKFDIIFFDPPYYQDLVKKTLKTLGHYDIVAPNGLIICQHFKKDSLLEVIDNLSLIKQKKYGDTRLSFYKKGLKHV